MEARTKKEDQENLEPKNVLQGLREKRMELIKNKKFPEAEKLFKRMKKIAAKQK